MRGLGGSNPVRSTSQDYRAIRPRLDGTINDIVITILAEAAARYLKHHGMADTGKSSYRMPGKRQTARRRGRFGESGLNNDGNDTRAADGGETAASSLPAGLI